MKFRSLTSEHKHYISSPGSMFRKNYIRKGGDGELVENGVENVYDTIQKASVGITVDDLVRRAKNGDISAVGVPLNGFADMSKTPKDLLDAYSLISSYKDQYNSLPKELRSQFGNNFNSFLQACGDGSIDNFLQKNLKNKEAAAPREKTLSNDELTALRKLIGGKADVNNA